MADHDCEAMPAGPGAKRLARFQQSNGRNGCQENRNMTKPDDDYVLIGSPLSGPMKRDAIEFEVCIYSGEEEEPGWILEFVAALGSSTQVSQLI
jgi:hypothetical protein